MKFLDELRAQGRGRDIAALVDYVPYARFLGIEVDQMGDEVITVLRSKDDLIGNQTIGALHGGVVGAMLELTATLQLLYDLESASLPRTVDVSFDYLRSAQGAVTYGRAIVTRRGRRVANVRSELWQESRDKPVALCHGHFVLTPLDPTD